MSRKCEDELKELVCRMHEMEVDSLPEKDWLQEEYKLSETFFAKMKRLIKSIERKDDYCQLSKIAAIILLIISGLWAISNPEYMVQAGENFMEWFSDHVEFQYKEDTGLTEIPEYVMEYVPEGYELESYEFYDIFGLYAYVKEDDLLTFEFGVSDVDMNVNNEKVEYKTIMSEDMNIIYYFEARENERRSSIIWYSKTGEVVFTIAGRFLEEELLKMQQSVKEIK